LSAIAVAALAIGSLCAGLLLTTCTPPATQTSPPAQTPPPAQITPDVEVEEATVFEHDIQVTIGDRIVLGRITDELADLGTVKKGDNASYIIIIHNGENNPVKVVPSASGNISELVGFDYQEVVEAQSSANITVLINADAEKGSYSGLISVKRGS